MTLVEIAKKSGVHLSTVHKRVKRGWSDDEIINGKPIIKPEPKERPPKPKKPLITIEGVTVKDIAKTTGLNYATICARHKKGWSLEKIMSTPINPKMSRKFKRTPKNELIATEKPWEPDPYVQTIAQNLTPEARLFCCVVNLKGKAST